MIYTAPPIPSSADTNWLIVSAPAMPPSGATGNSRCSGWLPRIRSNIASRLLMLILFIPFPERLFRRLGHFTLPIPGIEPVVDCKRHMKQEPSPCLPGGMIQARVRQYPVHRLHGRLLDHRCIPFPDDHLSPFIQLLVNVDLHRTYVRAGTAQCRGERQVRILFPIEIWRQDGPDGAPHCGMIAVPAAAPVDRTGIKTSGATDTFQRISEIGTTQVNAPAIVHEHHMHLLPRPGPSEVTRIGGDRLPRCAARQQAQKNTQVPSFRDQLLDAHTGDMHIRQVCAHVCVAFVSAYDELTRFRHGEVDTGQGHPSRQEFLAEMQPGRMRQEFRIGVATGRTQVLVEDLADLFLFLMDAGEDDMTRRLACQLDDTLAQVGVDYVNSLFM